MRRGDSAYLLLGTSLCLLVGVLLLQHSPLSPTIKKVFGSATVLIAQVVNPLVPADPTPEPPPPPPPSSGGGGASGGGGGAPVGTPGGQVTFSGRAFPNSTIVLLKDGSVALSTVAGGDAKFEITLINIPAGSYIFSVYGKDSKGISSAALSFPITLTAGGLTTVGGLFISPTLATDKSEVRQGDTVTFFGATVPLSAVTIQVHSTTELYLRAQTGTDGVYLYNLDSSTLEKGAHTAKSKSVDGSETSGYGTAIGFTVGDKTIKSAPVSSCSALIGDLNCDGHVNLTDFSIMVYWYKRTLTDAGKKADLNHDGVVNLVDFSILVSHWTG